MHKNQRRSGVVLSYVSILASTLVQILYTPFLIRMLGKSEYGLYSLVAAIIGYLTVLDLGFGNAIVVYTAKFKAQKKQEEEQKLHGMFKIVFMAMGIFAFLLGFILYLNVDLIFGNTMTLIELKKMKIMLIILSINLLISFAFSIYNSIISAYEKFEFQKIVSILGTVLKPLIMIPFLIYGYKAITMCIIISVVNIIINLSNYYFCRKKIGIIPKYEHFDKKLFKIIFGYSIWIFLGVIVDKINWSLDNFILGAISGTAVVSIYSVAATLNQLFINLSTAISGVFLPKMSKLVAKNSSPEVLTNEMIKVGRIQNYVIFLACSGLILFGRDFIHLWVGKGYDESYFVALVLIIPLCLPLIQNLGLSIMQAMDKFKFKSIITSIMAVINVIISIFLAKKYGAIGAAIGTGISLIICNVIIMNIYYYTELKINIIKFWKSIIKQVIPFSIPILIIVVLDHYIFLSAKSRFFAFGITYIIIYSIVAYFISMNNYEKDLISYFLKKKNKKDVY